jgi:prepilin-type N-terminal cleavage/methylation domain-containing protein
MRVTHEYYARRGFSLVEILVAVSLLAVIMC